MKFGRDGTAAPKGPDNTKNVYDPDAPNEQFRAYRDEVMQRDHLQTAAPAPSP
ncbi:MAG: hypothetical protein H6708_11290 [Kofleriaceae bacterium]|nr:hypothetical protein [Kofleriaceae bacterium]